MSRPGQQSPTLATRLIATLVIAEAVHFFAAIALESWHFTALSLVGFIGVTAQRVLLEAAIGLALAQWVAWKGRVSAYALPWHQCWAIGAAFLLLLFALPHIYWWTLVLLFQYGFGMIFLPNLVMNAGFLCVAMLVALVWLMLLARTAEADRSVEYRHQSMMVMALFTWLGLYGGMALLFHTVDHFERAMYRIPEDMEFLIPMWGSLGFALPVVAGLCWRFPKSMAAPHLFRVLATVVVSLIVGIACLFGIITGLLFLGEMIFGAISFRPGIGFTLLVMGVWMAITVVLSALIGAYLLPGKPAHKHSQLAGETGTLS